MSFNLTEFTTRKVPEGKYKQALVCIQNGVKCGAYIKDQQTSMVALFELGFEKARKEEKENENAAPDRK